MTGSLPFHHLANLFPLIEGEEFQKLVVSIGLHGQRDDIVLFEGAVLDGRNKYRACIEAGIEPRFTAFPPEDDALAFVIDKNLRRRHLDESQRSIVAAKIANLHEGRPSTKTPPIGGVSTASAALMLNVGERSVERAKVVLREGTPELQQAVLQGAIAVSTAAEMAKLPLAEQAEVIRGMDSRAFSAVARERREEKTAAKAAIREKREADLGEKLLAAPEGLVGVIYEDFEWDTEVHSRATGMDRHAANHYPVAANAHTPEEILARTKDRFACAAPDCILAMWTTVPHLAIALDVMRLRQFAYKSHFVWVKTVRNAGGAERKLKLGMGRWNRNAHEVLLIGVRGNIPCVAPGQQWPSVIFEPVGAHSAKPERFAELIESYFPTLPKIELNRRGPAREHWRGWGLEAEPPRGTDSFKIFRTESGERP